MKNRTSRSAEKNTTLEVSVWGGIYLKKKQSRLRDEYIFWKYYILNLAKICGVAIRMSPWRIVREFRRYPWLMILIQVNRHYRKYCRGRRGTYLEANARFYTRVVSGIRRLMEGVLFHKDRLVLHQDMVPPEIIHGMGLVTFIPELMGLMGPMVVGECMEPYIDAAENEGIPPDLCSLVKSTIGQAVMDVLPEPCAVVASNMPCDGGMHLYLLIEEKMRVPVFRLDVPYRFYTQEAVDYFVGELERLIAWLEEHTPGKMDWERMKAIVEERNKMAACEMELWEMLKNRPAPMAGDPVIISHLYAYNVMPGHPDSTKIFQEITEIARYNLENKISAIAEEKYRVLVWNAPTFMFPDLFNWAENTWGCALIMDSMTFSRLPLINTDSRESMLRGLAETIMTAPMARHTRGPAERYVDDVFYLVKQFHLDMVWVAGHIGCKNTQAVAGMLREKCKLADIPVLFIHYDLSDTRIVNEKGIKEQVNRFMETVMQADHPEP